MGPLKGVKVVEMAGIGPGPWTAMALSDMGADVIRIDRKTPARGRDMKMFKRDKTNVANRGRRSLELDIKDPKAVETVLKLVEKADAIIDVFRPGVMERLGLGPDVCLKRNPKLVYGRMTGWGQEGPLAKAVGHDINYIAITGALHHIGPKKGPPSPPLNLVGDYAGALGLAFGICAGIIEARTSGKGQVCDTAMCDIASLLMAPTWGMRAQGGWVDERESNSLDGASHYYGAYETKDGKFVSIASIESHFYEELLARCKITDPDMKAQLPKEDWPRRKAKMVALFKTKTRDEWNKILEGSDVCYAPVLDMGEALKHPHNIARNAYPVIEGVPQPAPAPRFSRTPGAIQRPPCDSGEGGEEALADWGFAKSDIATLKSAGTI
jgi:alpha-methylacyl-CoA racemase